MSELFFKFVFILAYISFTICLLFRGKKRKGLAATYLIEDDVDNRWILMPPFMASKLKPVAESEIQEVTVEIAEETPKVSGTHWWKISVTLWMLVHQFGVLIIPSSFKILSLFTE